MKFECSVIESHGLERLAIQSVDQPYEHTKCISDERTVLDGIVHIYKRRFDIPKEVDGEMRMKTPKTC